MLLRPKDVAFCLAILLYLFNLLLFRVLDMLCFFSFLRQILEIIVCLIKLPYLVLGLEVEYQQNLFMELVQLQLETLFLVKVLYRLLIVLFWKS